LIPPKLKTWVKRLSLPLQRHAELLLWQPKMWLPRGCCWSNVRRIWGVHRARETQ
jgi:hypothetical protein